MSFYLFTKDLRDLYLKTKLSSIESLYLKCAQSYASVFGNWILKNNEIRDSLADPQVYDALKVLVRIRTKYPDSVSQSDVIKYFMNNTSPAIPVIVAFNQLLTTPLENILTPYKDIIVATSSFQGDMPDAEAVKSDLEIIQKLFLDAQSGTKDKKIYAPKKGTKTQQKMQMFSWLLKTFSADISKAASNVGLDNFADAISNGAIAKPETLSRYVNGIDINAFTWEYARKMAKFINQNLGELSYNSNYNFVKEKAMSFVGFTDPIELLKLYNLRDENIDMTQLMDPDKVDESVLMEDVESLSVSDAQWLDPGLLSILSAFFITLYTQLR